MDEKEMYKLEIEALRDKYKHQGALISLNARYSSSEDDLTVGQHVFLTILIFYGIMAAVIFAQLTT